MWGFSPNRAPTLHKYSFSPNRPHSSHSRRRRRFLFVASALVQMSALIDKRWESIVRDQFDDLVQVLDPYSFLDRLFRKKLVTKEEYHRLRSMPSREEKSRALLSDILPRKGETSYDQFVTILRETEGQEHVVKVLGERIAQRRDFLD